MLVTSASRSAAQKASAFPAVAATSPVIRGGLPRFVIRQRRHSSSKHWSTSQQQPAPVTSGAPKQQQQQQQQQEQQQQQQQEGKKSEASSTGGSSSSASSGNARGRGGRGNARNALAKDRAAQESSHKTADNIVADVHAQLENVAMPPSVPSTSHYDAKIVHLASLFAQHRPISLHQPVPPQESQRAFDSIFASMTPKKKSQDVIFTLASAVKSLENAAGNGVSVSSSSSSPSAPGNQVVTPSPFEPSGPVNAVNQQKAHSINLEELAKQFRPFNAPPAPVPMDPKYIVLEQPGRPQKKRQQQGGGKKQSKAEATAAAAAAAAATAESAEAAKPPPMPEGVAAEIAERTSTAVAAVSPFRQRMRARQGSWVAGLLDTVRQQWQLISVKRQRRIKMKKHKFKKLLRRTRNLRRRLDKA